MCFFLCSGVKGTKGWPLPATDPSLAHVVGLYPSHGHATSLLGHHFLNCTVGVGGVPPRLLGWTKPKVQCFQPRHGLWTKEGGEGGGLETEGPS